MTSCQEPKNGVLVVKQTSNYRLEVYSVPSLGICRYRVVRQKRINTKEFNARNQCMISNHSYNLLKDMSSQEFDSSICLELLG